MKYDKIRGNSIAEMMMQLRSQFGNSVYIIQTKEIRQGGLFGSDLLSRKQFEIEYMVSEGDGASSRSRRPAILPVRQSLPALSTRSSTRMERTDDMASSDAATADASRKAGLRPATAALDTNLQDLDALIDSLKRLKDRGKPSASAASSVVDTEESALRPISDAAQEGEPLVKAQRRSAETHAAVAPEQVAVRLPSAPRVDPAALLAASFGDSDLQMDADPAAGMPTREELEALFDSTPYSPPAPASVSRSPSRLDRAVGEQSRYRTGPLAPVEGEDALSKIHRRLLESQASPDFADRFMQRLERSLSEEDRLHPNRVRARSLEKLKEMIRLAPTIEREHGERKVVFLVGPNGSGKTTSLAKLAAKYHIHSGATVSVFSLDHYRLAATEQLKTYAAVLMVPFHAPVSPSEFLEFLDRDGSDYVFVDTSGLSLRDGERLEDLRRYIDCVPGPVEVHLVLSVSTSPSLTEKYMGFFDSVGFEKIMLTRMDEADFLANFVEVADKWKRPFSFLMNGQTVPEHVLHVEPEELARMVLGLSG